MSDPPASASPDPIVDPLHDAHERLTERFMQHQERLIGLELIDARADLETYVAALRVHIAWEEARLFPAYAERVTEPPRGGSSQMFQEEHRKIERLLEEVIGRLDQLIVDAAHPRLRRGVLALIERELTLAHLLEHHHLREERILVPELEAKAGRVFVQALLRDVPEVL